MPSTISGHDALPYGSLRLRRAPVPTVKGITLTTARSALPLFLNLAKRCHHQVRPLSTKDTWSHAYRPPRAGSGYSDHAGWAIDLWASTIGADTGTGPTNMTRSQAEAMSRILTRYVTPDGRLVFGWGTRASNPGVNYPHTYQRLSDPMHVFVRPGITAADLIATRKALGIGRDGLVKRPVPR